MLPLSAGCGGEEPDRGSQAAGADTSAVVLAWVGGRALTVEDVRNFMKEGSQGNVEHYMHNPDILQVALSSLVDQFVWADAARREGFRLTEREQLQVDALAAQFLANRYVADVVNRHAQATESQIEAYYRDHLDRFMQERRVAARHILVPTRAEADRLKREAEGGADFAALARTHSRDETTREVGGTLGFIAAHSEIVGLEHPDSFNKAVLALLRGHLQPASRRGPRQGGGAVQ
jgi:peptidyl-prolyl cis-trans isomerase C